MKDYLFILCPPFQGSTVLYRLLNTSPNVSTFLPLYDPGVKMWMGEGAGLFEREKGFEKYIEKRWDSSFVLDIERIAEIYHDNWDMSKSVLCDKTPPTICRAKMFENEFSKHGRVHFILMVRDPYYCRYSAEEWNKYAAFQKWNNENLENSLLIKYEDLCDMTDVAIDKILTKFPFLDSLDENGVEMSGMPKERGKLISNNNLTMQGKKRKTNVFSNRNYELLKYFDYKIYE